MLKHIGLAALFTVAALALPASAERGGNGHHSGFGRSPWQRQGRSRADCRCQPVHPARRRRLCLGAALPQPQQGRANVVIDAHLRIVG